MCSGCALDILDHVSSVWLILEAQFSLNDDYIECYDLCI